MNLRAQWILSQGELEELSKCRQQKYISHQGQEVDDRSQTRKHLTRLIHFLRRRKRNPEMPLKFEKVIYYAVALFKRYYLLHNYINEEPTSSLLCALYISFKLNQYEEGFVKNIALKWKERQEFEPSKRLPSYGDEGYTEAQLKFLQGIYFQTAISKLIQPVQALYHQVTTSLSKERQLNPQKIQVENADRSVPMKLQRLESQIGHDNKQIFYSLLEQLERVYLHQSLMFLFEGPKIALAIMVRVLKKMDLPKSLMGPQMNDLSITRATEIDLILETLSLDEASNQSESEMSKNRLLNFKRPQPKKPQQSPPFRPRNEEPHDFS